MLFIDPYVSRYKKKFMYFVSVITNTQKDVERR